MPVPSDSLHAVIPSWLFDWVKEQRQKRLSFLLRIYGDVTTRKVYWGFAQVLGHYLAPLQTDEGLRKDCHLLINCSLFFPIEYQPIRTYVGAILMLPLIIVAFVVIYGGSPAWRKNRKLLYAKANLDWAFGRRRALAKAKQRLLELGEPAENLAKLVIRPDLRVIENNGARGESE